MGWVMMNERELNRVEVLAQVDDGRLSVDNAAKRDYILTLIKEQYPDLVPTLAAERLA